ncbi:DUF4401 domain-containing protein [Thalassobaculum sp.]|uniref:DUF4401 domain-containing protein n=1 Tax=Thalassobaculum sp. TaxID=2022740 RepID=UPI0032EDD615
MSDARTADLCRRLDLDSETVHAIATATAHSDLPWYMHVLTGIGAWFAATAMILTVGAAIFPALDESSLPLTAATFGAVVATVSAITHRSHKQAFAVQLAVAGALAGQGLLAGGMGWQFESVTVAAVLAGSTTTLFIVLIKDQLLQFLASTATLCLIQAALIGHDMPQAGGLLAAPALAGALTLLIRPLGPQDLRGLAYALLLIPVAAQSVLGVGGLSADWLARATYAIGLIAMLWLLWHDATPGRRALVAVAGAAALLLGAVIAAGMLASLLLLTLAYTLGNRMLASLGVAATVWFLGQFYYDLELDLLQKSGMLVGAGLLLLALWWHWHRQSATEPGHA